MAPGVPQNSSDFLPYSSQTMHLSNIPSVDDNNIDVHQQHNFVDMALTRKKSVLLIGVILADDRTQLKSLNYTDSSTTLVLGTVCLEDNKQTLEELRRVICSEVPSVPASFQFLTKEGWPVHRLHEQRAFSSHVIRENNSICIKKEFDKPRIGIQTITGNAVGFVFTELSVNIRQLRESIEQQLKPCPHLGLDYRFLERNGWPVNTAQEHHLQLLDLLIGHMIRIQNYDKPWSTYVDHPPPLPPPIRPTSLAIPVSNLSIDSGTPQEIFEHEPVKRKKSIKFRPEATPSFKFRKDSEKRPRIGKDRLVNPILISYVRAEGAQYALDLKHELVALGFSVYLDVHEIKTGSDWQDALNFAVTNCFLFVPLITPMYGKTQWTNREVKLADVLGKKITPVNFMDDWPPPCLAIQFASTQFIPWKIQEVDHAKDNEKSSDSKTWDPVSIKRVARQIADCYKDHYYHLPKRTPSNKELAYTRPMLSPREDVYSLCKDDYLDENKRSIVISCHPRQRYLAEDLKLMFEKIGHEVWCSFDLLELPVNVGSDEGTITDPNTPRNLPTIQEGGVFFSQNDLDAYSSTGDKKSLSMYKEQEAYGRRPLSRLMSQFSDISQPSTLSREKLDHLKTFQQKVDQAAVIIVLVSEAYTKSTFSHQQVFYCEHRKRVVMVRCDVAPVPKWFRLLMGNDMIMKVNNPQFECVLKSRVKRAINPSSSETPKDATSEVKMNYLVNFLKRNLPLEDMCVYVAGSSKLQSQRAEEICRAIGTELAKVEKVSLVTGGFFGAADITAKTFYECRENNIQYNRDDAVVHILPMNDSEDLTAKARQNPDGSFEALPYGKTVFLGDSVKERETVVARLLDTCIVIEGGPGVVHEVEEFIWNDHFVIPIMSTGGAAGGQYGVPVRIFEVPPGVNPSDWSILSEKDASPESVAKAVVNIMVSLKQSISTPPNTLPKSTAILKRKSRRKLKSKKTKLSEQDMQEIEIVSAVTDNGHIPISAMRSVFEIREESVMSQSSSEDPIIFRRKNGWWRRFINSLRSKK